MMPHENDTKIILTTNRLILRTWKESDIPLMAAISSDPLVMEHFPSTQDMAATRALIDHINQHYEKFGYALYAVELKDALDPSLKHEGTGFIGFVGLNVPTFEIPHFQPTSLPIVEIGWRLSSKHWGKGYATEAAKAVLHYAFTELKLNEVISFTVTANTNSRRVMEKIGLHHSEKDDFDHPKLEEESPLKRHVLYRLTKNEYINQCIIDCLNESYDIKVNKLTFLPLGADMNASVYKAETNDHSYFIKLKRGHHQDISTSIITLLYDAGIQHIIPPIKTKDGKSIQHINDFTLTVYPFVDGQDGFNRDLTNDQWVILGKAIKQIHDIDVPPTIQRMIRREDYSPKWREAVRSLYAHIESKPGFDEISAKLIMFMKDHAAVIHRLVDRAEQLGKQIQDQPIEFVLCHSDIHGGNVLIDGNDIIYMVDWDDPIMAPKERDLMFIGGGVANVWNKAHEEEFFYKGYGKTDINMSILAYYRHERIVKDIAFIGEQILLTSMDNHSKAESYKHFIDQFDPNGVVEIAFKTDEGLVI
jgi:spectinomycin phosphotransferase